MSLRLAAQSSSFGKCHFPVFSYFAASDSDVMDRWVSSGWQTVGSGSTCTFDLHLLNLWVIKNKHEMTDCSSKNPAVFPSFFPLGMCVETSYGTATTPCVSYGFIVPPALVQTSYWPVQNVICQERDEGWTLMLLHAESSCRLAPLLLPDPAHTWYLNGWSADCMTKTPGSKNTSASGKEMLLNLWFTDV